MSSSSKMIELRCSDGETFHVEETVLLQSETITQMIVDDRAYVAFPLPVPSETLAKVIEYIKKHAEKPKDDDDKKVAEEDLKKFDAEFVKVDHYTLLDLLQAANYLDIESLFVLVSQASKDSIKNLKVEEVRKIFGTAFTPEEVAEITREEGAWANFE